MPKLSTVLYVALEGAVLCGIIGAVLAGIAARGTSVALPGIGLVVAGPLVAGITGGLTGAVVGFVIGLVVGAIVVAGRR